ncbi:hypothetical protein HPP92_025421 [Vanilla planifolia]|uniref:B box-type domain-containing protein n=1 Tax=Vanilla planifolia TaxID=51239 RepID=A0A835PMA2_VANPL|nr:hypothetical protein HPP92_025421 [Vanilla planifolia]
MKLLCDVCGGKAAAFFCVADEAALCAACDDRIHRANKLAIKHARFSLIPPSGAASSHPFCDICKERRGFLFCQEDRAILCFECDSPIHSASQLTMKHSRFVLTGIRLSLAAAVPQELDAAPISGFCGGGDEQAQEKTLALTDSVLTSAEAGMTGSDGSSISEYLIKMLPGYCVEDLLVEQTMHSSGDAASYEDANLDAHGVATTAAAAAVEGFSIWAPQVPQFPPTAVHSAAAVWKPGQGWWNEDEMFAVPQVPEAASRGGNKRQRDSGGGYYF